VRQEALAGRTAREIASFIGRTESERAPTLFGDKLPDAQQGCRCLNLLSCYDAQQAVFALRFQISNI